MLLPTSASKYDKGVTKEQKVVHASKPDKKHFFITRVGFLGFHASPSSRTFMLKVADSCKYFQNLRVFVVINKE
jgi:hypothetical protein